MSKLIQAFRRWWFNNEPGYFHSRTGAIDRTYAFEIGGPSPDFDSCETCQLSEWDSRAISADWHIEHKCKAETAGKSRKRCKRQGDDAWINYHQDFTFAEGVDPALNAPKGALLFHDCAAQYEWFRARACADGMATFRQRMAYIGTYDAEARIVQKNWDQFDWAWFVNKGFIELLPKPPVPMILYCHDAWRGNKQEVLDHYRPEVIVTPFPTLWTENFDIPPDTRLEFYAPAPSPFFTDPNLDDGKKEWDLLDIGSLSSEFYVPRRELCERLKELPSRFRVEHSHATGSKRARWPGPMDDGDHCYMKKWAQRLGRARFVIFGPCAGKAASMVLIKYYECLASGAIPIMPDLKDLDYLGVKPMVHFLPFDPLGLNMKALEYTLDHYADYRYIAENAVGWWHENAHRLIFGGFEEIVRRATGYKYPKREL